MYSIIFSCSRPRSTTGITTTSDRICHMHSLAEIININSRVHCRYVYHTLLTSTNYSSSLRGQKLGKSKGILAADNCIDDNGRVAEIANAIDNNVESSMMLINNESSAPPLETQQLKLITIIMIMLCMIILYEL